LVIILALVSLLGVGYSLPPEQEIFRAVVQPFADSETPSRPSAAGPEESAAQSDQDLLREEAKEKLLAPRLSAPVETCSDVRELVDRSHSLPPDFVPDDLVPLRDYEIPALGSDVLQLRREAAEHLGRLVEAAVVPPPTTMAGPAGRHGSGVFRRCKRPGMFEFGVGGPSGPRGGC
jgi:hypothetical protein